MKKNLTYMLSVTSDYVFAAGNIVLSLIKQRPQKDFDVTIFYEDMLPNDKKIFEETGICNLIQYKCPEEFEAIIRRDCPKFNDETFAKHFSFLKFAKFEIFTLLEKYHHAIWLDADIAIQGDISDITEYEPFAITIDRDWTVQNNFTAPIVGYDMNKQGVCSAVFMISDKLKRYSEMCQWCYDKAAEVCPYFSNIDQGIFNILLQEFKINYQLLPLDDYQCIPYRSNSHIAKIVHFGPHKIWKNTQVVSALPEWYRIHLEWMSRGGSDYTRLEDYSIVSAYQKFEDKNKEIKKWKDKANNFETTLKVLQSLPKPISEKGYKIKIFGITLFKKKIKSHKVQYYLLGLRFLTVKTTDK